MTMKVSMQFSTYFWLSCLTILVAVAVNLSEVSDEDIFKFFQNLGHLSYANEAVTEGQFDQIIDHFNHIDYNKKFKQRYFINDKYYDSTQKEPIVLFVVAAMMNLTEKTLLDEAYIEFAKNTNALMIALEPRFYGKSHPFQDLSVENLYYLNSEQALADFAYFKEEIPSILETKHNIKGSKKAKWITTGREYGGSYCAWYKLKFPHEITAAVPLGAPMWVKPNYDEFFDRVERFLYIENYKTIVHNAYKTINYMLRVKNVDGSERSWESRKADMDKLEEDLKLCSPLYVEEEEKNEDEQIENNGTARDNAVDGYIEENDDDKKVKSESGKKGYKIINENISLMFYSITHHLAVVALGSEYQQYRTTALLYLTEEKKNDYERFTNMIRYSVIDYCMGDCLANDYHEILQNYRDTSIDNLYQVPEVLRNTMGTRQKLYQHCFEMGMFNTAGRNNYFFKYVPVSFSLNLCKAVFNPHMTIRSIELAINNTNLLYGSLKFEGRNTVFLNRKTDMYGPNELKHSKSANQVLSIVVMDISKDFSMVTTEKKHKLRSYYYRTFVLLLKWVGIKNTINSTENQQDDESDYYTDDVGQSENLDAIQHDIYLKKIAKEETQSEEDDNETETSSDDGESGDKQ